MQVQWFPGHMAKTRRIIQEQLKLVDAVLELVDARLPLSSRNPLLNELLADKPRIVILNKADLADDLLSDAWLDYFKSQINHRALKFNSTVVRQQNYNNLQQALRELTLPKRQQRQTKGIRSYTIRTMVVGIPNVGKSTFINALVGRAVTKTGNKPGVTRGQQWIRLDKDIDLLDTPGLLWPKFEDPTVGFRLAVSGAISDDVFDFGDIALQLVEYLRKYYPGNLQERYALGENTLVGMPLNIMEEIGRKRGALLKGGAIDYTRTSRILIQDFRDGRLGRITLDRPDVER